MPYGISKETGGDSKENEKWMSSCVSSVMSKSKKDKSGAIAICKAQLKKKKNSSASLELLEEFSAGDMMDMQKMMDEEDQFIQDCMKKMIDTGKAKDNNEARMMCDLAWEQSDCSIQTASMWILQRIIY